MNHLTKTAKQSHRSFQQQFLRSWLMGLSDTRLHRIAMYHFNHSRTKLVQETVDLLCENNALYRDFLSRYPLNHRDRVRILNDPAVRKAFKN